MELLQLRYFKDAAELENFSKVAEKNMVPQPSISKTIRKLETELGANLFDRAGKKVSLNSDGKYFYEKVSAALGQLDEGVEHFTAPPQSNITIYTQAGSRFVSLLIADFITSTANIFISCINYDSANLPNKYDFTFIQLQNNMSRYNYEILMQDEIVAVVSLKNKLSRHNILSIKDFAGEDFVAYYRSINLRDFTDEYCIKQGGFIPNVVFETHDYSALRYMLDNNKGIALMPKKFFQLQHSDKVKLIELKEKTFRTLTIAWDTNKKLSSSEKHFLEFTKSWFRKF